MADLPDELREDLDEYAWIFSDACKSYLAEKCHTAPHNILFFNIKLKDRLEKLNKALINIDGRIYEYVKIFPTQKKNKKVLKKERPFVSYILIPKSMEEHRQELQRDLLAEWRKNIRPVNCSIVKEFVKKIVDVLNEFVSE